MPAADIAVIESAAEQFRRDYEKAKVQIQRVVVGHEEIIDGVLTCLFADGHALLEGVPGLGKTRLGRSLAQALPLGFSRTQFTPAPLPELGWRPSDDSPASAGSWSLSFMMKSVSGWSDEA